MVRLCLTSDTGAWSVNDACASCAGLTIGGRVREEIEDSRRALEVLESALGEDGEDERAEVVEEWLAILAAWSRDDG